MYRRIVSALFWSERGAKILNLKSGRLNYSSLGGVIATWMNGASI
jgi:hypothetical protein